MKAQKFKTAFLVCIILFVNSLIISAQQEVSKEFHEEYDASDQTSLLLDNKYGNIDIRDWDRQQVKIDVFVTVKHSNPERAQRLLDDIDVSFSSSGNQIKVVTEIDPRFSRNSQWGNGKAFEINYTVQMPKQVNLELYNKYGNVFISELTGEAQIDVSYGKLTANKLSRGNEKPLHTVNLAYSNGCSISECDWLKANIKYSRLTIDKATAIVSSSRYSKLFVEEASSVVIDGKYDGYEFGKLANLVIMTSYSGIQADEVSDKLELELGYTDTKIESMPASFESVNINSRYGTIRVGLDKNASYRLDGEAGYSKIYFHDTGKVSRIQENTSMKVSGTVGPAPNPLATVKVSTRYGNVRLDY
jgi:hypothetical protein